jgi:chromosome segregation ATPase
MKIPFSRIAAAIALAALLAPLSPAGAEATDRDRAQLLQMQQQLQRLQQDNASLQSKTQEDEAARRKEAEQGEAARKSATSLKAELGARGRELAQLRADIADTSERLAATQKELEQRTQELAQRDQALAAAAALHARDEQAGALVAERLKVQTGRADLCETRHAGAMDFATRLLDQAGKERLRLCEPVTGIWKVGTETRLQDLHEELGRFRLDAPEPAK